MTTDAAGQPGGAHAGETSHPFKQTGKFGNFAPLALKNALLGLVTLTLYRFWGRTEMRRRIWASTTLMDDALEYTGTGMELFRGFLIAIPVFFIPFILVFYVAPLVLDPVFSALLLFAFYPIALPMLGAALYLMRRYQLSRTRWRGIRFGLGGSAVEFGFASFGWMLLEGVTLGWYHPAARMRRARRLWSEARFGDQPFTFAEGETELAKGLYGPYAIGWIGSFVSYFVAFVPMFLIIGFQAMATGDFENIGLEDPAFIASIIGGFILSGVLLIFLLVLVWAPFNAAAMNRTAELLALDGARFKMKATTFGIFGVQSSGLLVTIFTLGILSPVAGMWLVRYMFNRLEMIGSPRLDEIYQGKEGPGQGEGIADAFDLDFGAGAI
jgi:uncharacterized membrane protein YjgN (DUF898 family)